MQEVLDEIVEKVPTLTSAERRELIQLLQEEERKAKTNGKKGSVHPNTIWVKEHRAEYAGKYVALDDGKLVGIGKNYPEALVVAKQNGSKKPMITYIFPPDSEPFGGW
ncbi:MAG: DUF5678 domain-containing protein [Actinomycetota bacterium]